MNNNGNDDTVAALLKVLAEAGLLNGGKKEKVGMKYAGDNDEEQLDNWIKAVEVYDFRYKPSPAALLNAVVDSLEGKAATRYADHKETLLTWEALKADFEKCWRPADSKERILDAFFAEFVQNAKMDAVTYTSKFEAMEKKVRELSIDDIMRERYIRGFKAEVRQELRRARVTDREEILHLAIRLEKEQKNPACGGMASVVNDHNIKTLAESVEKKQPSKRSISPLRYDDGDIEMLNAEIKKTVSEAIGELNVNAFGAKGKPKCFFCGVEGHVKGDCKYKEAVCFKCHDSGHVAKECPKSAKSKKD